MRLLNGKEVIAKPYKEDDAKEIVNLILRNFREVNVKDYGEKTMGGFHIKLLGKSYGKHFAYYFCASGISWAGDWQLYH